MTSSLSSLRLPAALLLGLLAAAVCAGGPVAGCASDGAGTPGGGAAGASGVSGKGGSDEPGGAAGLQGGAGAGGDAGAAANTGAGSGGEAGVSGGGGSPGAAGSGGLAGEGGAVACAPLPAGCPGTAPSFAEEVAPRLHASCWPCHNAGGVQSKRLLTDYAHVMPQRGAILSQLASCLMPPSGSPPLSEADRTVILDWLLCGAPGP